LAIAERKVKWNGVGMRHKGVVVVVGGGRLGRLLRLSLNEYPHPVRGTTGEREEKGWYGEAYWGGVQ